MISISKLISIIMPCYNASRTVAAAIQSVMDQSYSNWELFVIDDCSTDDTSKLISSMAMHEKRLRIISNHERQGAAISRNRGVSKARGLYIAFIDADDYWYKDKLSIQAAFMEKHGAAISCTGYGFMDFNGNTIGRPVYPPSLTCYKKLLRGNTLCCPTVMVNTELMKKHKFSNDAFHEDYLAWLTLARETGAVHGLRQVLALYRVGHKSKSANKLLSAGNVYDIYRNHLRLPVVRCAYLMMFYTVNGFRKYLKR